MFNYWYELARELGYYTAEEMREGDRWVLLSGTWEKFVNVVERVYIIVFKEGKKVNLIYETTRAFCVFL